MRGSGRIIVIDNAQRLARSAREWLFDWQDATGCSIALVGNPEIVQILRKNDQQFSRVPFMVEVTLGDTLPEVAREMIRQLWPEALEEILEEATVFAAKKGQLRKLSACVRVAREIIIQKGASTATLAFRQAAEMSLSEQDYASPIKRRKPRL